MGCIVTILALLVPRLTMIATFVFTDWFPRAFDSVLWPVLGFVFMPYTTLAWMAGALHGGVQGGWLVLVVLGVIADLSHMGGGGHHYRSYRGRR